MDGGVLPCRGPALRRSVVHAVRGASLAEVSDRRAKPSGALQRPARALRAARLRPVAKRGPLCGS
eukprot:15852-Alexandrium_andersonii.AAC.1